MTVDRSPLGLPLAPPVDATVDRDAAEARSLLSCPGEVSLVVDGLDDVGAGLGEGDQLGMRDVDGVPTFVCPPEAALAEAAASGRRALLTVSSGLGPSGSAEREGDLRIEGRLSVTEAERCPCCPEPRVEVALRPDVVLLRLDPETTGRRAARVPTDRFTAERHRLNRGFLQRSVEHANSCHQEELRHAVSMLTGTRLGAVIGVQLSDLRPDRVELRWVDRDGAHGRVLGFRSTARSADELGDLLRRELHAGLC